MALNTNVRGDTNLDIAIANYYDKMFLDRLMKQTVFDQYGDKKSLPKNSGNTIVFTRYDNFAANTTPLTEGVNPDGLKITDEQITAIPAQYGDYVAMSDALIMESIDPVQESALDLLSYRAALSLDTIIRNTLHSAVTNQFANGAASEAAITASDVTNAAEMRKAAYNLRKNNVRPIGSDYVAVIHPAQIFDVQSDTAVGSWLDLNKYTTTGPTLKGEIGKLYGIRVTESTNVDVVNNGTVDVYRSFVFGKGAYGLVDLAGMKLKTIRKPLGSAGTADALDLVSTVGYKFWHKTVVLDATRAIELFAATAAA